MNQDKKRSLTEKGRESIQWLLWGEKLEPNFLTTLGVDVQNKIRAGKTAQERLRVFAQLVPHRPFPRYVIETLAYNKDPTRRTRRDKGSHRLGGMRIISGKYRHQRQMIESLGYCCSVNEFISVYNAEIEAAEKGER